MKKIVLLCCALSALNMSIAQTNYATDLDGTDQYIIMGDVVDLGTSNWTIEAWIYMDSWAGNGMKVVNKGLTSVATPSNSGYGFRVGYTAPQELDFAVHGDGGTFYSLNYPNMQLNQWYHIAAVRRGAGITLYIDCQEVDFVAIPIDLNIDTDMPLTVGAIDKGGLSFNDHFFDGNIDEVRIWNVAKDSSELCLWKDCTINAPTTGLLAVYNMDHTSGTVASDNSGNGYDGTVLNGGGWEVSGVAGSCVSTLEEETKTDVEWSIFPNPVSDILLVNDLVNPVDYQVLDMSGKVLQTGMVGSEGVDVQTLAKGTYVLRLSSDEGEKSLRFVKQ